MNNWIESFIETYGYGAIFLLMLVENVFPPIPSEVILPLSGYVATQGDMHPALILCSATAGALLGCTIWYFIGRWINQSRLEDFFDKYGVLIAITCKDYTKGMKVFEKYQRRSVLFGRLIPVIRTVISVPAGLAKMSLKLFLTLTLIGTALWSSALIYLGYALAGEYERVADYASYISNFVIIALVIAYLAKVFIFIKNRNHS